MKNNLNASKKKIAFFDAKQYDIESFNKINSNYEIHYFESKLNSNTVVLAKGMDAVCVFVNDVVDKYVIEKLNEYGKEGWELISTWWAWHYFKREIL